MWQKVIPIESTYGEDKKSSQNIFGKCYLYKKGLWAIT
jgi:hypothetical protein